MLDKKIDKRFDDVMTVLQTFMLQVDERFNSVEKRLDDLDKKYVHLITTIDDSIARIDTYDKELKIRDRQFERLVEWAHKVSEKTGIPLENL